MFITLVMTWLVSFIPLFFKIENETVQDVLFKALAGPTLSILGAFIHMISNAFFDDSLLYPFDNIYRCVNLCSYYC